MLIKYNLILTDIRAILQFFYNFSLLFDIRYCAVFFVKQKKTLHFMKFETGFSSLWICREIICTQNTI